MSGQYSIAYCLSTASAQLSAVSGESRREAEILLCAVLHCDRTYLFAYEEKILSDVQREQFSVWVARRQRGEPIAYIVGERDFWSLTLSVNNSTLIPRHDTETLVETALQLGGEVPRRILDLGTGTGAIALALATERPAWTIEAVDVSVGAVHLAQHNAEKNGVANVCIYCSDWFSSVNARFDMIVSNPPYIAPNDKHLLEGDVRFEPLSALVAADDGFADLFLIVRTAKNFLYDGGWLLLEHGFMQGEHVRQYLQQGGYQSVQTVCDLSGNERVTYAQWLTSANNG